MMDMLAGLAVCDNLVFTSICRTRSFVNLMAAETKYYLEPPEYVFCKELIKFFDFIFFHLPFHRFYSVVHAAKVSK